MTACVYCGLHRSQCDARSPDDWPAHERHLRAFAGFKSWPTREDVARREAERDGRDPREAVARVREMQTRALVADG